MDNHIGNAVAAAFGIRLAPEHVVPNAVRFGRKPSVSVMSADVINLVHISIGIKVWMASSIS